MQNSKFGKENQYDVLDNYMVLGPCLDKNHSVCLGCLRRILHDHSLLSTMLSGNKNGQLQCLASGGDCCSAYDLSQGPKILMTKKQFDDVSNIVSRYQDKKRDHHVFDCITKDCPNKISVKYEQLDYAEPGNLTVNCSECSQSFCYHCHNKIDLGSMCCQDCIFESKESKLPFALNRYIVPSTPHVSDDKTIEQQQQQQFIENCKLQWIDVKKHLDRLAQAKKDIMISAKEEEEQILSSRFYNHCSVCDAAMEKSTECNELSHCGQHMCCMCGRRALPGRPLESSHWKTCQRFNKCNMSIGYKCGDYGCNTDEKRCDDPDHQEGIKNLELYRIHTHIHSLLRSLPSDMNLKALSYLSS